MHQIRLVPTFAAIVLCLVAVAGPSSALAQSPSAAPLTLTFAIANEQGEPSQPAIDAFIEQVTQQSGGSIVIDPLYGAGNATEEGFEAGIAGLVERGEADLGLNASRAWDLMGVTSLQALQAPFLITDGALATAVATSDIAERALAGMADKGVTGLTLWPEDLRHPFALGAHAPYLTPADFGGANILVQPSALSRSLITTLGGTLYVDGDREADAASGLLQGAESGLLQGHTLPGHPTATGDVTFYPKFQVISANSATFEGLTQQQQDILRSAAAETQRLTIAAHTSEADAAAAWCANGGTVVLAGAGGVAAFEAAAKPVFDAIGKDPLTATLISDIQALKATTTPAPGATACNAIVASATPVPSQIAAGPLRLTATWDTSTTTGLSLPSFMDIGQDGSLYVVNAGSDEILVLDATGAVVRRWGEKGLADGSLNFQRDANDPGSAIGGVAVAPDGSVYVADAANFRVQQFDAQGTFVRKWGTHKFDHEPGDFVDPIDVAAAPDGTVYVVDDQRDDIQHFSADGTYLETIGKHGTGDGELNFTGSVFVDPAGTLYNADWDNDRVQAWGPDGAFLWSFGTRGTGPGQLNVPGDVGVDAAGNIYVADRHRVQVFAPDRSYIGGWVAPGTTENDELIGLTVGPDGRVYVSAPWSNRIYQLQPQDALASGSPAPTTGAVGASPVTFLWSGVGAPAGMRFPGSVTIDPQGRVWVADTGNSRFAIFTPDGAFVEYWGSPGNGDGQFKLQRSNGDGYGAIAFAPDGSFYVLDVGNRRVQHFGKDRGFLGSWGSFGTDPGQYNDPIGLAVDATGMVYVLDDVRDVIERYDADGTVLGSVKAHPDTSFGFNTANSLSLDSAGNLYVSDCCGAGNQVKKLDPAGALVSTIGGPGAGPGHFSDQPGGIAVDAAGRVFVTQGPSGTGDRIQVFAADGTFLASFGSQGSGDGQFGFATNIVLDGQGAVYVADAGSSRVEKFQLLPPFAP